MKFSTHIVRRWETIRLIAFFLAMLVVGNLAGVAVCDYIVTHSSFRFSRITTGGIVTEALVIGSSRGVNLMVGDTTHGFPTTFNLSFNGLGGRSAIALTKEFFSHGNRAHYVILEASTLLTASPNCEIKTYWNSLPLLKKYDAQGCQNDAEAGQFLPLTLYDTEIFLRTTYYMLVHRGGDQTWTDDYTMTPMACASLMRTADKRIGNGNHVPPAEVQNEVAELRGWLREHAPGTKLVLVLAPYFASSPALSAISENVEELNRSVGAENYLDLATSLGADCRSFADGLHIIGPGRAAIRPVIVRYLRDQAVRP